MVKKTIPLINNQALMEEYDYEKNISLDISKLTCASNKKVWWICPQNHSYESQIANRAAGCGCPHCAGKKVLVGYNDFSTWCKRNNRVDLLEEFDTIRNTFSAEEVTIGSGKKVWWICPNGHSYQTSLPHRIKMNTGCGICSHKVFLKGYNDLETTHPEIAKEFDSEKKSLSS